MLGHSARRRAEAQGAPLVGTEQGAQADNPAVTDSGRGEKAVAIGREKLAQLFDYQAEVEKYMTVAIDAGEVTIRCSDIAADLRDRAWGHVDRELRKLAAAWSDTFRALGSEFAQEEQPDVVLDAIGTNLRQAKLQVARFLRRRPSPEEADEASIQLDVIVGDVRDAVQWIAKRCTSRAQYALGQLELELVGLIGSPQPPYRQAAADRVGEVNRPSLQWQVASDAREGGAGQLTPRTPDRLGRGGR